MFTCWQAPHKSKTVYFFPYPLPLLLEDEPVSSAPRGERPPSLWRAGCGMRRLLARSIPGELCTGITCMRICFLTAGLPAEAQACFRWALTGELSSKVSVKPPNIQSQLVFPGHLLCVQPGAHSFAYSIPLNLIATSECGILSHSTDGEGGFFKGPQLVITQPADLTPCTCRVPGMLNVVYPY